MCETAKLWGFFPLQIAPLGIFFHAIIMVTLQTIRDRKRRPSERRADLFFLRKMKLETFFRGPWGSWPSAANDKSSQPQTTTKHPTISAMVLETRPGPRPWIENITCLKAHCMNMPWFLKQISFLVNIWKNIRSNEQICSVHTKITKARWWVAETFLPMYSNHTISIPYLPNSPQHPRPCFVPLLFLVIAFVEMHLNRILNAQLRTWTKSTYPEIPGDSDQSCMELSTMGTLPGNVTVKRTHPSDQLYICYTL